MLPGRDTPAAPPNVNYNEFALQFDPRIAQDRHLQLKEIFNELDKNKDGSLSLEEIC